MANVNGKKMIQVTAARPEGWPVIEIAKRILIVGILLFLLAGLGFIFFGAINGTPECCPFVCKSGECKITVNLLEEKTKKTFVVNCNEDKPCAYGFGPNGTELRKCPTKGTIQKRCRNKNACYLPNQIYGSMGTGKTKWYRSTKPKRATAGFQLSSQCLKCPV